MATFGAYAFPGLLGAGLEKHGVTTAARLVGVLEDAINEPIALRGVLTELIGVELGAEELDFYGALFASPGPSSSPWRARRRSVLRALRHCNARFCIFCVGGMADPSRYGGQ